MSSKKKNLDDELSDVSSEEENIVNFAKKGDKKEVKSEKNKKKEEKILSKKTKREKESSESQSDSESEKSEKKNKKVKKDKTAHDSDENKNDKNEKKDKKNESSSSDSNDSDDDDDEKEYKIKPRIKNEKKKEKKEKSESESNSDDSNDDKIIKPKENKKQIKEKEKGKKDSDKSSEEEEEEEKEIKENQNNDEDEPKLVKNTSKAKENEESEDKEEKPEEKKSYNSGTWPELFVNNLSYKTTDDSLKKYFSKYGEVESTKIVIDKETGRPKGVGFCKFCDSADAAKALADNDNLYLDGRPLAVSYSNDKKGSAKVRKSKFQGNKNYSGEKYSIFIGNLSFKTNEDGIKNLFEDCGNIIDIRIAKRPDGNPRGFAHVDFDTKEAMDNALEKTGYRLDGRELRIDKTTNQPSNSKKTFGENSYYKNKKEKKEKNYNDGEKEENEADIEKAKKTGKIINTGSKSQKIENSDSDSDDDE